MTLLLDSSALFARYLATPEGDAALAAMEADHDWCASALAQPEVLGLIDRLAGDLDHDAAAALRQAFALDWERVAVIPVDGPCLDRAGELLRAHPLRTIDALHLAAADRLPRPLTYLTFDHHQIPVALALGLEVAST